MSVVSMIDPSTIRVSVPESAEDCADGGATDVFGPADVDDSLGGTRVIPELPDPSIEPFALPLMGAALGFDFVSSL